VPRPLLVPRARFEGIDVRDLPMQCSIYSFLFAPLIDILRRFRQASLAVSGGQKKERA
jgi:hypothetical protein